MPSARSILGALFATAAVLAGGPLAPRAQAQKTPAGIRPPAFTRTVLPNGLVVVLNADHSAPIVALDLRYHFGSQDERPGQTGFAHICEHLMGEGSPNLPQLEKAFILSLGGSSPATPFSWGSTAEEQQRFYYTVPSNELETALWMESDRMAAPLSRADDAHLKGVREIVRQERAQNRGNAVFGDANRLVMEQFFPGAPQFPREVLGPMEDLDAANAAAVTTFCRPYYVPNNAVLTLSGDFDPARATQWARTYFGGIPRGAAVHHPSIAPTLRGERRIVLEDPRPSATPRLRISWLGAASASADRAALSMLAAVLAPQARFRQAIPGADREGKISRALVYDRQTAGLASAAHYELETTGVFEIEVEPRPNVSLSDLERQVDSVLALVRDGLVKDADLVAFKQATVVSGTTALQGRAARADALGEGEVFAHDPVLYAKQADRTLALTAADVQAAARKYLTTTRVVTSLIPAGKLALIARPELPYTNVTPSGPAGRQ